MALLFFDGFDDLSLIDDLNRRNWIPSSSFVVDAANGRFGGTCIKCNVLTATITRGLPANIQEAYIGFAIKRDVAAYADIHGVIELRNPNYPIGQINLSNTGAIQWEGYSGLTDSAWTDSLISEDTWYFLEIGIIIDNAPNGYLEVRLNGQTIINLTGVDTLYATPGVLSTIEINGASGGYLYYDDLYICDNSGTTNNTFLGNVRVTQIKPTSAGNYTQFTPSSGNNYECVDDSNWEGTDYNQSATTDQIDTFNFEAVSSDLSTIKGIQVCNGCKRYIESDTSKIKHVIRKNSTDYISSAEDITDDVKGALKIYETDPEDSNPWTKTKIDATEFGYQSNLP